MQWIESYSEEDKLRTFVSIDCRSGQGRRARMRNV